MLFIMSENPKDFANTLSLYFDATQTDHLKLDAVIKKRKYICDVIDIVSKRKYKCDITHESIIQHWKTNH